MVVLLLEARAWCYPAEAPVLEEGSHETVDSDRIVRAPGGPLQAPMFELAFKQATVRVPMHFEEASLKRLLHALGEEQPCG